MLTTREPLFEMELMVRWADQIQFFTHPDGCWVWTGKKNNWGYGVATVKRYSQPIHRLFYETLVGPIPEGLVIDHTCRNRLCVNPQHLQPLTHKENVSLGGTRKTHCAKGHPFDDENTLRRTDTGYRLCRICVKDRNHKAYLARSGKATHAR